MFSHYYFKFSGFSIAGGKFDDEGVRTVAGAPREGNSGAVVVFESMNEINADHTKKYYVLGGRAVSESFGYALCVADLNGDG